MKTFSITFNGRPIGSIGICSVFTVEVTARDIWDACSRLYETHEHIRLVTHSEVQNKGNPD